MTVGVVHLPLLIEKIRLRWWLDIEKWPGVISLLSTAKCVGLFASICRRKTFLTRVDKQIYDNLHIISLGNVSV